MAEQEQPVVPDPEVARVGRGRPTPARVMERRLVFVNTAWERGMPTYQIRQAIAAAAAAEAKVWAEHKADANRVKAPLLIWGEHAPSDRTVDGYIARVVAAHEASGNELSKKAALHMGKQLARLEAGYLAALSSKTPDLLLALRYLREIGKFLGINAAATLKLGGIDDAEPIKVQDVPMAPHTEDGVYSILGSIADRAQRRIEARKQAEERAG